MLDFSYNLDSVFSHELCKSAFSDGIFWDSGVEPQVVALAVSHLGYPIKVKPLKMPYSAGVHPIAIGKSVQKTGLPYNNSLYPN